MANLGTIPGSDSGENYLPTGDNQYYSASSIPGGNRKWFSTVVPRTSVAKNGKDVFDLGFGIHQAEVIDDGSEYTAHVVMRVTASEHFTNAQLAALYYEIAAMFENSRLDRMKLGAS